MRKRRLLLALALVGVLTGCGAPQENAENNKNNQNTQTEPSNGKDGVGIVSINITSTEGNSDIYTITYTDGSTSNFKVTNGKDGAQGIQGEPGEDGRTPVISIGENGNWIIDGVDTGFSAQGEKGETGNGIELIEKDKSEGNVDTYIIYFTDGTTSSFTVTNGENGEQGIQGEPGKDGHTPVITIGYNGNWFIDGEDTGVSAKGPEGEKGDQGEAGKGIYNIVKDHTNGNVDTYIIYFTDGSHISFDITNGENGEDGHSAFEIFKEYYPEYEGSEKEWIEDIINGKFNKVTVTFDLNGGIYEGEEKIQILKGQSIGDNLPVPEKKGKKFLGWYTGWTPNDVQVTKLTPINSDITLVAKWDSYDIKFLDRDEEVFFETTINHGEKLAKPSSNPESLGDAYTFIKWNYDFDDPVYSDLNISSVWTTNDEVIMTFGTYPQSVVSDKELKEKLSSLENADIEGTVLKYDSDNDGEKERYMVARGGSDDIIADDGSVIEYGINYFKYEPIEWRILRKSTEEYFLVSHKVIDFQVFEKDGYVYEDQETHLSEHIKNDYSKSDIREWLNNVFLVNAFSYSEQERILITNVENNQDLSTDEKNGYVYENTEDKVFLLSKKDVETYSFSSDSELKKEDRVARATDYSKILSSGGMSIDDGSYGNCDWRTRTPRPSNLGYDFTYYVFQDGGVLYNDTDIKKGVRPAIRIEP